MVTAEHEIRTFIWTVVLMGSRSPSLTPLDAGFIPDDCAFACPMERPDERACADLALFSYINQRRFSRRCLALSINAAAWLGFQGGLILRQRRRLGIRGSVPQIDTMAHLLSDAADAVTAKDALCWH